MFQAISHTIMRRIRSSLANGACNQAKPAEGEQTYIFHQLLYRQIREAPLLNVEIKKSCINQIKYALVYGAGNCGEFMALAWYLWLKTAREVGGIKKIEAVNWGADDHIFLTITDVNNSEFIFDPWLNYISPPYLANDNGVKLLYWQEQMERLRNIFPDYNNDARLYIQPRTCFVSNEADFLTDFNEIEVDLNAFIRGEAPYSAPIYSILNFSIRR